MSDQTRKRIASRLLARTEANRRKPARDALQPAQSPKRDTGPSVTRYEPEAPPWARQDWKPAATGASVSEALERHQRMQVWESLRAQHGGATIDMFGHRDHCPPGFDPITGHKL